MPAADSNMIVRLIAQDDAHQTALANTFIGAGVWISTLALAETVWVLRKVYKLDNRALVDAIEMLLKNKNVMLQDADVIAEALELFRFTPSLGLSDCLILELARKAGQLPLGTFDRGLAKVPGTRKLG